MLFGYSALAFAYFGWRLLPHPGRVVFGAAGNGAIYIWSFGWWAHAIGNWTNPLFSHALYAPIGVNIAWTPSAPGLALAFAPLTAIVGPVASYNVAGFLMPVLAAWTGYLLCRQLTPSMWAALVGGYLFGFSTAELRQVEPGNVNLSSVFLFPLVALVVLRHLRGQLSGRGLACRLGFLLAFQLTLSTEFAFFLTVALIVALALALWFIRDQRSQVCSALAPIAAGYFLAALFAAPFVYYLLFDFESGRVAPDVQQWGTDALAGVVPPPWLALSGTDPFGLSSHVSSRSAYIGFPTIAILVLFAISSRRTPGTRFLLAAFAVAFVATLGATLQVYGHTLFRFPWRTAANSIPGLSDALPFRLAIVEELVAAVIVSIWIAQTKGRVFRRPYVLPVLAVAALVPALGSNFVPTRLPELAFFTDGLFKQCVKPGNTLVIYPGGSDALIWQTQAGFAFNLAEGGLQPFTMDGEPLNPFDRDPLVYELTFVSWAYPTMDRMLAFAGAHHVDRVVSLTGNVFPNASQMARFGPTQVTGGAILAPACGQPPLTRRNLTRLVARWEVNPPSYSESPHIGWCYGANYLALPIGLVPPQSPTNRVADFVKGIGLTCSPPPPGFKRHGFAHAPLQVPPGIYPYFSP